MLREERDARDALRLSVERPFNDLCKGPQDYIKTLFTDSSAL
jgi:hypothetical protein